MYFLFHVHCHWCTNNVGFEFKTYLEASLKVHRKEIFTASCSGALFLKANKRVKEWSLGKRSWGKEVRKDLENACQTKYILVPQNAGHNCDDWEKEVLKGEGKVSTKCQNQLLLHLFNHQIYQCGNWLKCTWLEKEEEYLDV